MRRIGFWSRSVARRALTQVVMGCALRAKGGIQLRLIARWEGTEERP